jgi:tRNA pseudouridine38/39 synthase
VAFRIAYLGWDYHGLAIQESTQETIEAKLFECLLIAKLIEDTRSCHYSRCGRTDKGVSAFGQVVSLHVRSALLDGPGLIISDDCKAAERKGDKSTEISYIQILNRLLPEEIRVISWTPVSLDFSARFSCLYRVYKYFFPIGTMDVELMREAAGKLVGEHDFRNFCKVK